MQDAGNSEADDEQDQEADKIDTDHIGSPFKLLGNSSREVPECTIEPRAATIFIVKREGPSVRLMSQIILAP
jgi:hypothetical protein